MLLFIAVRMKFLVATVVVIIALGASGPGVVRADCTGEICCNYPNQGVGCDLVDNCKHYGGSIVGMCSTQCNCGDSIELAAVKLIGTDCTELGMDNTGNPVCLTTTVLSKVAGDANGQPSLSSLSTLSTVALLSQETSCPAFMHVVWSASGLICVANQLAAEQVEAAHVVPKVGASDPDCTGDCCVYSGRIVCIPNCSGVGQRVSCGGVSDLLFAPLYDDSPACYTCFLPDGSEACSSASTCMQKGGNPVLGCNNCR